VSGDLFLDCETLLHLVAKARALAGDHPCTILGHAWELSGGKYCADCGDSKPVYECARCGECDYGERESCGHECDVEKARQALNEMWIEAKE
jgi:hypothetical protein